MTKQQIDKVAVRMTVARTGTPRGGDVEVSVAEASRMLAAGQIAVPGADVAKLIDAHRAAEVKAKAAAEAKAAAQAAPETTAKAGTVETAAAAQKTGG